MLETMKFLIAMFLFLIVHCHDDVCDLRDGFPTAWTRIVVCHFLDVRQQNSSACPCTRSILESLYSSDVYCLHQGRDIVYDK